MSEKDQVLQKVLQIAQQIWAAVDATKLAVYDYSEYGVYRIDIAVGIAIGKVERWKQCRRFNKVLKNVNRMGYYLDNQEGTPVNYIGVFKFLIAMAGDFGLRDNDPDVIKTYFKQGRAT